MKTILSALAAAGALSAASLISASPAAAQSYYGTREADYRAYCQDEDYYERYRSFCSRYDRDDADDDNNGYDDRSSYDDNDDAYDDDDSRTQNSNYNYNRTYMPNYDPSDNYSTDGGDNDQDDNDGYDYGPSAAVPGRTQGNTGGYGQGNDSNSYTGQRSTTH